MSQLEPSDDAGRVLREEIVEAYYELVRNPDGWVKLIRLRDYLANWSTSAIDAALWDLDLAGTIRLLAEVNTKVLTPFDHRAAVVIGGLPKHLYQVVVSGSDRHDVSGDT